MIKNTAIALAVLAAMGLPQVAQASDSNWVIRGGIANVSPDDSSGIVLGNDGVAVDSASALGLSFTYFYDTNWGVEILAATPFKHDITGVGALKGVDIGSTKQLPPTVSLVYQWGEQTKFHVGAGVNHTVFFDSGTSSVLTNALGANKTDLDLDSSTGLALKAGFDIPINDNWSFTGSVYWIDIDTNADVIVNGAVATTVDVQIDPMVYMLGFGTKF